MATKNDPLTTKQLTAGLLLAGGLCVKEVAKRTRSGERTIRRWMTLPAFRQHVSDLHAEVTNRALGRLIDALDSATGTLLALLSGQSEHVRLSAARSVLEFAGRMREAVDIESRLRALEDKLLGRTGGAS